VICWYTKVEVNFGTSGRFLVANKQFYTSKWPRKAPQTCSKAEGPVSRAVIGSINIPIWKGALRHVLLIVVLIRRSGASCVDYYIVSREPAFPDLCGSKPVEEQCSNACQGVITLDPTILRLPVALAVH